MGYLVAVLIIMAGLYAYYRMTFLTKHKKDKKQKPHFTLKIESDS